MAISVWRLMLHHQHPNIALSWTKQQSRIAMGPGLVGDIKARGYKNSEQIGRQITAAFQSGTHPSKNGGAGGVNLWNFACKMQIGDLVILSSGKRELVVRVDGAYEFVSQPPTSLGDYNHQRKVELTRLNPEIVWHQAGSQAASGSNTRSALIQLSTQIEPLDDLQ